MNAASLERCTKTYRSGTRETTIGPLDLAVADHDYVALVGPSGSGKTTAMSILGSLSRPTTGRAIVGGVDVGTAKPSELSELRADFIGFVFQQFHLLANRTALENVMFAFGPPGFRQQKEQVERCVDALAKVGLSHRVGVAAAALSGGEQQRVALARALVKSPRLLLCDEPTGNLDDESASIVLDLVEDALDHAAVVIVTHDRSVAMRAGRIIELHQVADAGG